MFKKKDKKTATTQDWIFLFYYTYNKIGRPEYILIQNTLRNLQGISPAPTFSPLTMKWSSPGIGNAHNYVWPSFLQAFDLVLLPYSEEWTITHFCQMEFSFTVCVGQIKLRDYTDRVISDVLMR